MAVPAAKAAGGDFYAAAPLPISQPERPGMIRTLATWICLGAFAVSAAIATAYLALEALVAPL